MKKLISILLLLVIICSMAACGQSGSEDLNDSPDKNTTPDSPGINTVNSDVYDELIGQIYDVIAAGQVMDSELEGVFSLYAGLGHMNASEMLQAAGYAVEDINGDGVPELILGMVTKFDGEQTAGNIIYTLFTCADDKPVLVFESFVRNSYAWLGDGKFHYYGSGGAANAGFGTFTLPAGGTEMECEEFRFTDFKPDSETEIGYYYNTSGSWSAEESEELEVSNEAFWEMETEALEQIKDLPFTQFINYDKAEIIDTVEFWAEGSNDTHLAAVAYLGYTDGGLDEFKQYAEESGILAKYPFLDTIDEEHTVLQDGGQWYAAVPDDNVTLTAYDAVPVESAGTVMPGEEELLASTAEPVLIRCNVSDIYPNVMLALQRNEEMPISYSPQQSMKGGSLEKSDYIFDFTPYELMPYYLMEVVTDPEDPEYVYYSHLGPVIATPVVGNEEPEPILVKALKDNLIVRTEMTDDGTILDERILAEGDVIFISAELLEDSPLMVTAIYEEDQREGCWYAVTDNGEKHYRETICG